MSPSSFEKAIRLQFDCLIRKVIDRMVMCEILSLLKSKKKGGGAVYMKNVDIPIWEKYTLAIEEASVYFRIGEKRLCRLEDEHKNASWLIANGNRIQIKRKQFEKIIDELEEI